MAIFKTVAAPSPAAVPRATVPRLDASVLVRLTGLFLMSRLLVLTIAALKRVSYGMLVIAMALLYVVATPGERDALSLHDRDAIHRAGTTRGAFALVGSDCGGVFGRGNDHPDPSTMSAGWQGGLRTPWDALAFQWKTLLLANGYRII